LVLKVSKFCPKCGETKPAAEFHASKSQRDGLNSYCKPCWNAYCRERWDNDANKPERLRVRRNGHLRAKYGITLDTYEEILARQDGRCAICRLPAEEAKVKGNWGRLGPVLSVDHDHGCCPGLFTCGDCVRGLLCETCNRALGYVERAGIENVVAYIARNVVGGTKAA